MHNLHCHLLYYEYAVYTVRSLSRKPVQVKGHVTFSPAKQLLRFSLGVLQGASKQCLSNLPLFASCKWYYSKTQPQLTSFSDDCCLTDMHQDHKCSTGVKRLTKRVVAIDDGWHVTGNAISSLETNLKIGARNTQMSLMWIGMWSKCNSQCMLPDVSMSPG